MNDYETFTDLPKSDWPKKWVTCKKCRCDWHCTGYPAGKQNKFTDHIKCHQLVDKSGCVWLWPYACQSCCDRWSAKPNPVPKPQDQPTKERAQKGAYQ